MSQNQVSDKLERCYLNSGYDCVIGIDEVGRGSWAGPVVVGAYIYRKSSKLVSGVNDSKKLTPKKRTKINKELSKEEYFIARASPEEIDELNIVEATGLAIRRVVRKINIANFFVLLDGYFKSPFDFDYKCIKKGDQKHYSIAAASILAKVNRDNLMIEMSNEYSDYGFETNVGYGTKKHRLGLEKNGVCKIHRKSYAPIKKLLTHR